MVEYCGFSYSSLLTDVDNFAEKSFNLILLLFKRCNLYTGEKYRVSFSHLCFVGNVGIRLKGVAAGYRQTYV